MSQSSTTEALEQEVTVLREQLLDIGQAVTDLTTRTAAWQQALVDAFGEAGRPVPASLRDERPTLTVIRGARCAPSRPGRPWSSAALWPTPWPPPRE